MKKTHWLRTTVITLAVCFIAGVILALILFNANPGRTGASSSIEFSFSGAAKGQVPSGYRFDLSGFTSDEVLEAALNDAGLADRYTVDQIRSNILVSGVYPQNIVDQMTRYESILTGDASKVKIVDYHATLYSVMLYNDFDKSISSADLKKLLAAVMEEFRAQFEKVYSSMILAEDSLLADINKYDYPQQLEILDKAVSRYGGFAQEMADAHPDFRVKGQGFQDLAARYRGLQDSDMGRLSSLVTLNALFRDPDWVVAWYENRISSLEIRLKELAQEQEDTEALIAQYTKDDIIYVSTSGTIRQVINATPDSYDKVVERRQEIAGQIADLNKELAQLRIKLGDIKGSTRNTAAGSGEAEEAAETAVPAVSEEEQKAQKAEIEEGIAAVVSQLNTVTEKFSALLKSYSEREMNDRTVSITDVRYKTPKVFSVPFLVQAVRTAGPLCALGLIGCLIGLVISRRKQEKAMQKG